MKAHFDGQGVLRTTLQNAKSSETASHHCSRDRVLRLDPVQTMHAMVEQSEGVLRLDPVQTMHAMVEQSEIQWLAQERCRYPYRSQYDREELYISLSNDRRWRKNTLYVLRPFLFLSRTFSPLARWTRGANATR